MNDPFEALRRIQKLQDSLVSPYARLVEQLTPRNYALESMLAQQHRLDALTASAAYISNVATVAAEAERVRGLLTPAYDPRLFHEVRGIQADIDRVFAQTGIHDAKLTALAGNYADQLMRAAGVNALDDVRKHVAAMSAIIPATTRDPLMSEILANIMATRMTLSDHISGLREVFPYGVVDRIEVTMRRQARLFEGYSALVLPTLPGLAEEIAVVVRDRITTSSRGLKSSADVVEHLDDHEADDEGGCEPDGAVLHLLREFDEALVDQYLGALAAFNRRGPDSARQVAISLRELLKFVVERAAPTRVVIDWLSTRGQGRTQSHPTDRDRLSYIWRGHRHDERVLVAAHVDTIAALRVALSAPTHEKSFNAAAMRGYVRSLEGALLLILQTRKGS